MLKLERVAADMMGGCNSLLRPLQTLQQYQSHCEKKKRIAS